MFAFFGVLLLCFAAGWYTAAAHGVTAAGQAAALVAVDPTALSLCDARLRAVQLGFVLTHAWCRPRQQALSCICS
jgi:hypothetical protein